MEEDIKILEELIEIGLEDFTDITITNRQAQAIENLIARYKEVEEENQSQQTLIKVLNEKVETFRKENVEYIIQNRQYDLHYIPKSKVKEKIEDLNIKMAEQLKIISEFGEHEKNRAKLTMYKEQRDILGELLGES